MRSRVVGAAMVLFLLVPSCSTFRPRPQRNPELRGVWVATVANLDWPSRPGLPADAQKRELLAIFDRAAALGLNAVFLQVRPAGDAIYPSSLEPWSEYLTGEMGKAPEPFYDPLAFAVEEAHARGLELHAWFNPFRARHSSGKSAAAPTHVTKRWPAATPRYGAYVWMDPGDADVRRHALEVIADVVKRYDVDGVHLDDYFYPYPERDASGERIPFPDLPSWTRYRESGGSMTLGDWRRNNIDRFVEALYTSVKSLRPRVEVGISPFGIWRPGYPSNVRGLDAYGEIYADARLWLRRGWIDYMAPQLYWPTTSEGQPFARLLRWWTGEDVRGRGIVAGISINRAATGRAGSVTTAEIAKQISLVRRENGAVGFILFSARTLMEDRGGINTVLSHSIASGTPREKDSRGITEKRAVSGSRR